MGLLVRSRIPHRPRGEQGRPLVHRSRRRHRRGRHGDQLCARRDSCGDRHTARRRQIPDDRGQRHDLRDARGYRCGCRCDTTTADELCPVATGFGCEDDDGHFGCDQFGPDRGSIDEHTESGDGAITGTVNGSDVDLNTLTYSVPPSGAGAPGKGTVSIDRNTGAFTYQPSTGARLAAQSTSGPDFDTFTVNVYDGQVSTPVMVTVAVLPATPTLSVADTAVALGSGSDPSAVAVYGNRTYVANATAGTVKVLNTDTNQVVASIPVQTSPAAVGVSPDGESVWVANSGSKTVQRIESQSNTVVATVTVGTRPTALAVTGDSVWVANAGSNYVSRISTATNKVVATTTVGSAPSAIAVSGDQVYVANKNGNSISVVGVATNRKSS